MAGYIARGMTNAEIGDALSLTEDTVKQHLAELFQKRGARNRQNLVAILAFSNELREVWQLAAAAAAGVAIEVTAKCTCAFCPCASRTRLYPGQLVPGEWRCAPCITSGHGRRRERQHSNNH